MTDTINAPLRARPAEATVMTPRMIALLVAGLGTALYCAVAFGMSSIVGADRFGTFAYNYYFLALLEGRFDVPLRVITLEGHYDAAGHAYIYHGLAPLITRAIAWPFVDLAAVSLAPLTVFLAAAGGTAVYHLLFMQIIEKFAAHDPALQRTAGLLLAIMIWFASPGLLLVANDALYGEPIAMAYFFVACFLALLAQAALFDKPLTSVLVPMAVFAGLCVYARPHLALGLYAATCLLGLLVLWQKGWRGLPSAAGAVAVLGAFGGALLVFNHLRFGNMIQMHGSSGTAVEHGFHYWGYWVRSGAPKEWAGIGHGSFFAYRTLPNLMLYLFDLPGGPGHDAIDRTFRYLTSDPGRIRVTSPRLGMFYYWLPWFVLALAGVRGPTAGVRHSWALLVAAGIGGLMMASYVTVSMRYRFDLWPFLAVIAMLALPRVLLDLKAKQNPRAILVTGLGLALVPGLAMMLLIAYAYAFNHVEHTLYSLWSYETCAEMVRAKQGLGPDAVERLCAL